MASTPPTPDDDEPDGVQTTIFDALIGFLTPDEQVKSDEETGCAGQQRSNGPE